MQWIDMHCDTLSEIRKENVQSLRHNSLCVDLDRLKRAGAQAQFFACFVNASDYISPDEGRGTEKKPGEIYGSEVWDRAYAEVIEMADSALREEDGDFHIIRGAEDLTPEKTGEFIGGILTVEEGGVLNGKTERLEELYKKGVRLLTLTWNYENCLGSPNSRERTVMDSGLKRFGMEVVERMNDLGMIIDVSHLSDGGFRDCIRHSRVPVVASHSNARSLCPHPRNLSDEMLRALGEKGGTVGVNFYSAFLRETDGGENRADAEDIVRHVRWMMNQAGEDAVALGTDFDGFARADLPKGIQDVRDMEKVWETMRRAGITPRQIDKIASGNIRRVIREIWR